jgi:hypothetical protein
MDFPVALQVDAAQRAKRPEQILKSWPPSAAMLRAGSPDTTTLIPKANDVIPFLPVGNAVARRLFDAPELLLLRKPYQR